MVEWVETTVSDALAFHIAERHRQIGGITCDSACICSQVIHELEYDGRFSGLRGQMANIHIIAALIYQGCHDIIFVVCAKLLTMDNDELVEIYSAVCKSVHPIEKKVVAIVVDIFTVLAAEIQFYDNSVEKKPRTHSGTSLEIFLTGYTLGSDNFNTATIYSLVNILQSLVGVVEIVDLNKHCQRRFVR